MPLHPRDHPRHTQGAPAHLYGIPSPCSLPGPLQLVPSLLQVQLPFSVSGTSSSRDRSCIFPLPPLRLLRLSNLFPSPPALKDPARVTQAQQPPSTPDDSTHGSSTDMCKQFTPCKVIVHLLHELWEESKWRIKCERSPHYVAHLLQYPQTAVEGHPSDLERDLRTKGQDTAGPILCD